MSVFRDALVFFDQIGLYDVVLSFLLIFTLAFGILEKSKILGTEKGRDDKVYTRKNLNAMIAFIMGFFVVASAQLVELVNILVSRVGVVMVILVMLMLLIASFHKQQGDEGFELKSWQGWLSGVVLVAVILIFMDGVGWLQPLWFYVTNHWDSTLIGTILLFAIVIGFVAYLTGTPGKEEKKADS